MNKPMNKRIAALIVVMSLALPLSAANAAAIFKTAKTEMQMKEMSSANVMQPKKERDDLSLRSTAEMLGYTVMWNKADQSVTLTYMGSSDMSGDMKPQNSGMMRMPVIVLHIGSKSAMAGDKEIMLDQAPYLEMGVTMVSQQFIDMYLKPMM